MNLNSQQPLHRVEKPWGYELIFAHTDPYVGKILHIAPGSALSLQYHEVKDETLHLLRGSYELEVEEDGEMVRHRMQPEIGRAHV